MDRLARKIESTEVFQETGTVLLVEEGRFVVRTGSGDFVAKRAVSCLVEPQASDQVLVAAASAGCYILAVLERQQGAGAKLTLDGDLQIQLKHGRFTVAAQEGVSLASGKDVSMVSQEIHVHAGLGSFVLERLSLLGTTVVAEIERAKLIAGTFDSVLERLTEKVKRSYRFVEEFDQVRAERIDYVAKKLMSLRGQNAIVTAEELVKVDADQIHLG
jgi:hypothetical protein